MIHGALQRIRIPNLERQRIFNLVWKTDEIEGEKPIHRIRLAHRLDKLANSFAFTATQVSKSEKDGLWHHLHVLIRRRNQRHIRILEHIKFRIPTNNLPP